MSDRAIPLSVQIATPYFLQIQINIVLSSTPRISKFELSSQVSLSNLSSQSGGYEEFYLVGYNALQSFESQTFNRLHGTVSQKIEFS
jgi:hypothetical protein